MPAMALKHTCSLFWDLNYKADNNLSLSPPEPELKSTTSH
jgi:hypothetical protein